jgi:hypothetical protein
VLCQQPAQAECEVRLAGDARDGEPRRACEANSSRRQDEENDGRLGFRDGDAMFFVDGEALG